MYRCHTPCNSTFVIPYTTLPSPSTMSWCSSPAAVCKLRYRIANSCVSSGSPTPSSHPSSTSSSTSSIAATSITLSNRSSRHARICRPNSTSPSPGRSLCIEQRYYWLSVPSYASTASSTTVPSTSSTPAGTGSAPSARNPAQAHPAHQNDLGASTFPSVYSTGGVASRLFPQVTPSLALRVPLRSNAG